jgi:hypothetical protein
MRQTQLHLLQALLVPDMPTIFLCLTPVWLTYALSSEVPAWGGSEGEGFHKLLKMCTLLPQLPQLLSPGSSGGLRQGQLGVFPFSSQEVKREESLS